MLHLGHSAHSLNTMCLPDAAQKGRLFLQLGQSKRLSGISNLQKGQGDNCSGSSSCLTGLRAIPSILALNFGGMLSTYSGRTSTHDQMYACCLRLLWEHSPMLVVNIFVMFWGNWEIFWQTRINSLAAPRWLPIFTSFLPSIYEWMSINLLLSSKGILSLQFLMSLNVSNRMSCAYL